MAIKSQIKSLYRDKNNENSYYGFIRALDGGKDYYFTKKDLDNVSIEDLSIGTKVSFNHNDKECGQRFATEIKLIDLALTQSDIDCDENKIGVVHYKSFLRDAVMKIKLINDSVAFEDAVFILLKTIGINKIFQFDHNNQAGKADGFFIIENLAVMYDCTLQGNFESYKEEQIENYINKLSQKAQLTFNTKKIDGGITPKTIKLTGKSKQVWIITKGESKELGDFDNVKVKEISIHDLCEIYEKKLDDITYDNEKLVNNLIFIGK